MANKYAVNHSFRVLISDNHTVLIFHNMWYKFAIERHILCHKFAYIFIENNTILIRDFPSFVIF